MTIDPSVRYTIWTILIGMTFSNMTQYSCIQTQAQRYMCVKDTKAAQRYFMMKILFFRSFLIELLGLII